MKPSSWSTLVGLGATVLAGCGPDKKPKEGCDGPSFSLVLRTEGSALPADTRINVRYGSNQEGEPYSLGSNVQSPAVHCFEDTTSGGAPADPVQRDITPDPESAGGADAGGAAGAGGADAGGAATLGGSPGRDSPGLKVFALRCGLYTQGPARLDVTATGYQPVDDQALSFTDENNCKVPVEVELEPELPDASR